MTVRRERAEVLPGWRLEERTRLPRRVALNWEHPEVGLGGRTVLLEEQAQGGTKVPPYRKPAISVANNNTIAPPRGS